MRATRGFTIQLLLPALLLPVLLLPVQCGELCDTLLGRTESRDG